jgi:hypothetical protein
MKKRKECRMSAQDTSRIRANLNHLRRGTVYVAETTAGTAVGEYIGMEALYGVHAVLLRNVTGTESIYRNDILSIEPAVAA